MSLSQALLTRSPFSCTMMASSDLQVKNTISRSSPKQEAQRKTTSGTLQTTHWTRGTQRILMASSTSCHLRTALTTVSPQNTPKKETSLRVLNSSGLRLRTLSLRPSSRYSRSCSIITSRRSRESPTSATNYLASTSCSTASLNPGSSKWTTCPPSITTPPSTNKSKQISSRTCTPSWICLWSTGSEFRTCSRRSNVLSLPRVAFTRGWQ